METVIVEQDVPARMRDGITLYADVYRPAAEGRYPVLLRRTPYGRSFGSGSLVDPLVATRRGYVVVTQDTRGRFGSEGEFRFWATQPDEALDGYDTVEWCAGLPRASGPVGMFGASYLGRTQYKAARDGPPHLAALAPMQAAIDVCQGTIYRGGAFELGFSLSWHLGQCVDLLRRRASAHADSPRQVQDQTRLLATVIDSLAGDGYRDALPLADIPALRPLGMGDLLAYLAAPGPGGIPATWNADMSAVGAPSLLVGGWHDCHLQGTLDAYVALRARARPVRLVVGPWSHGNTGGRETIIGDVDYGMAASGSCMNFSEDLSTLHLRWFDRWLKGIRNGVDEEPPVTVYDTGARTWRNLADWPPPGAQDRRWYLGPFGTLTNERPSAGGGSTRYVYDPNDPAPTLGGSTLLSAHYPRGVHDQRPLAARPDVRTFASAPLVEKVTAMGHVRVTVWLGSSARDTDLVARLIDVHPDGYMEGVCDGIQRASYRDGFDARRWLEPGVACALNVDLWSAAHCFVPGHRIAVMVTSSSFPRWDRHWNTTDDPARATGGRPAEQTVWHDATHPSQLVMSVAPS